MRFYPRKAIRLKDWDYTQNGAYFITICTMNRENYFGEIINGEMRLNLIGVIAKDYWLKISEHYRNVILGEFVIMPNHVHGIIIISDVGTCHGMSLRVNTFSKPITSSISMIVNQYKSSVKRYANRNNLELIWHGRFYEHIIRNEKSLGYISQYILNNPMNWENDVNYNKQSV